ncbi:MAG: c-type cytochrome [Gemmataceae bacterium]
MAATDQHYRSQNALDVVFGVSCGLMLLTTVWMFVDDYNRSFKPVQRTFRDVEATVAERDLVDKLPDPELLKQRRVQLKRAREGVEDAKAVAIIGAEEVERNRKLVRSADTRDSAEGAKARGELNKAVNEYGAMERRLKAKLDTADEHYRTIKADLDSKVSLYNIEIDDAGKYPKDSPAAESHKKRAGELDAEVRKLEADLATAKASLDEIDLEIKSKVRAPLEGAEKQVAAAEDEMKKLAGVSDRFAKLAAQKAWTTADTLRALPILDGFESPIKIRQLWLPELTIDYGGFRDVPRFDRCTTCHLGIDKSAYDKETLARLGDEQEGNRLTAKLVSAKDELEKRARAGENLGFNPADLPGERQGHLGIISVILAACVLVGALSLGILQQSIRLGLVTLFAGLVLTLATSATLAWFSPRVTKVKAIKLGPSQVSQYATHPRLDLFVDSNSAHPMEKFGCTVCHSGQGSATDFNYATHTPDDATQTDQWKKEYHYHPTHFWDFPMLSKRFVESSCLKCHHQISDLVRAGGKEEAPKLLRGYALVREMGCFGCHEISGLKGGRPVGPDLRLEPTPALEWLSPAEQERAKADTANPPGTYRKVGPSLRRLSEKVTQDWTAKWVFDPRGFRPDTRMPHFYNLSTNSKEYLAKEAPEQENFPAAEVQAISHYLIQESKNSLAAKDANRVALLGGKKNLHQLQQQLVKGGLSDKDQKELYDVSRRFSDLALLSAPRNGASINNLAARQRALQERLAELHRRGAEGDTTKAEIAAAGKELEEVTAQLIAAGTPVPLSEDSLTGDSGDKVVLPKKEGDPTRGRELFTEKGCLACHAHEGTTKPLEKDGKTLVGAVESEANFGPELSRIADKLSPEKGRLWLVQWLMNPNVYHPRTRMPVTHLSPDQANDLAAWLLSQKTGWKGTKTDPVDPSLTDYKQLARVYLAKAPGVTRLELDQFLPKDGDGLPGIPAERMESFPRDADERVLDKTKWDEEQRARKLTSEQINAMKLDALKWYVGRKAIGRLGCFACHDIPGFETAKPIGTGLNDWGKKDGDKLAFEDGEAFARTHFNIVPTRVTRAEVEARIKALEEKPAKERSQADSDELARLQDRVKIQKEADDLEAKALEKYLSKKEQARLEELQKFFEPVKNGTGQAKEPFEGYYFDALEHHQREVPPPRLFEPPRLRLQPHQAVGRPAAHAAVQVRPPAAEGRASRRRRTRRGWRRRTPRPARR